MNYEVIERLIKLIDASSIRELDLEEAGLKIRMSKNDCSKVVYSDENKVTTPVSTQKTYSEPVSESIAINPVKSIEETKGEETVTDERNLDHCYIVKSPMVGTFYSSPTEDGEPYVKVGDVVSKDSTICIIEAMKLMNEIEAEAEGTVVKVFVNNGDVVEFGEPIMAIEI